MSCHLSLGVLLTYCYLRDLVDFCEDVHEWMEKDERNVIAVHCKGGKGRTGMMVAAWLVRSGQQAQQSLAYFRERRTDRSLGSKNQGVNTPSQVSLPSLLWPSMMWLHSGTESLCVLL